MIPGGSTSLVERGSTSAKLIRREPHRGRQSRSGVESSLPQGGTRSSVPPFSHLLVALVVAPLPISYGMAPAMRQVWTMLVLALLVGLLALNLGRGRWWGWWSAAGYLALAAGVGASSNALDPAEHWQASVQLVVLWGVAPLALHLIFTKAPALARTATRTFVTSQSVSSVAAIAQALTGTQVLWAESEFGRSPGLAGHTNILGILAAVAVLVGVSAGTRLGFFIVALNLMAVFVSGSLSSLFALLAGAFAYALVRRIPMRRIILASVLLYCAVWAVDFLSREWAAELRSPLHRVLQTTGQTDEISTLAIRIDTVKFALERISASWFTGAGLDDQAGATFDNATLTHNLLVRAWFQGGFPLAVATLIVFAVMLAAVCRAVRSGRGSLEAAIIVTLLAFSMTSATLAQPYFWLVAVAAWASLVGTHDWPTPPAHHARVDAGNYMRRMHSATTGHLRTSARRGRER